MTEIYTIEEYNAMKANSIETANPEKLPAGYSPHDGVSEWADCSSCGATIDYAAHKYSGDWCPFCEAPASMIGLKDEDK